MNVSYRIVVGQIRRQSSMKGAQRSTAGGEWYNGYVIFPALPTELDGFHINHRDQIRKQHVADENCRPHKLTHMQVSARGRCDYRWILQWMRSMAGK